MPKCPPLSGTHYSQQPVCISPLAISFSVFSTDSLEHLHLSCIERLKINECSQTIGLPLSEISCFMLLTTCPNSNLPLWYLRKCPNAWKQYNFQVNCIIYNSMTNGKDKAAASNGGKSQNLFCSPFQSLQIK
jgi:hypothetical protein